VTQQGNGIPNAIVVGDQRFADILMSCGAQWIVHRAAPSINDMWDAIETGALPNVPTALIVTDGTGHAADELESALAVFAPYTTTFIVADDARGAAAVSRAKELAPSLGGDPNAPIYVLPAYDLNATLLGLRNALAGKVAWENASAAPAQQPPAPPVQPPPAPPAQAPPQPQYAPPPPVETAPITTAPVRYQEPATLSPAQPEYASPPAATVEYDQVNVYPSHVAEEMERETEKLLDARPGQMTIACMSSKGGSGKCADAQTLVQNPVTGMLMTIEDLVLRSEANTVSAFDGRLIEPHPISDKIYSGEKETFTVKMRSGRTFTATANHPLLATDGWRAIEDLEVGETIATPTRMPFPSDPIRMNDAELDLLAILMAEGGTSNRSTRFTTADAQILEMAQAAAAKLGPAVSPPVSRLQYGLTGVAHKPVADGTCRCGCGRETDSTGLLTVTVLEDDGLSRHGGGDNHVLRALRRDHGLDGTLAKNKSMPDAVFRLPADQLSRFLSIFWMCDGYAVAKGGGDLGVTLASEKLIDALQHLLLRFGIQSAKRYKLARQNGKEHDAWRLTVHAASFAIFQDRIPLWGQKAKNLEALVRRAGDRGGNPNLGWPTFTDEVYDRLMAYRTRKSLAREVCDSLGWRVLTHMSPTMVLTHRATKRSGRKHLNLNGLRRWCELAGPDAERDFGWIYDSEIYWDEIESITHAGVRRVYDLEVPVVHNFVAQDIIVHNSTTAICLAGTIARCSAAAGDPKRVVVVDLDTRDGQIGSLIGQYVPTAINIRIMPVWDANTITSSLVHDKRLGVDALLAPLRPRNADDVGPDFYRRIIQVLQTTHDVVILDCSVNYLDPLLGVGFSLADEILFVTTLATTSVQGMARSLTEMFADPVDGGLGIPREKVGIVANQAINNVGMGKDQLLKAALGAPLVGQIPADHDAVLLATNKNEMWKLMQHPRLGPAYFKLATTCLPGWNLAPVAVEAVQEPGNAPVAEQTKKKGLFGRG